MQWRSSYAGCSLDGAYFHAKKDVTQHINDHFNVKDSDVHSDHDPMHISGLAEKRARKKTRNNWVNNLGKVVANNELFIAYNGPKIGEADQTLKAALDQHFAGGRWHFTPNTLFEMAGLTFMKKLDKKNKLNIY